MKAKDFIIIGGAVALFLLWKNQKDKTVSTSSTNVATPTNGATSQVDSFPTLPSNEAEQVYGLNLPTGMDLPALTGGTGVRTEIAIQQGGLVTEPAPAVVQAPPLGIEESLQLGGFMPIVRDVTPIDNTPRPVTILPSKEVVVIEPRPTPVVVPKELVEIEPKATPVVWNPKTKFYETM
jgi:hypothetical protein